MPGARTLILGFGRFGGGRAAASFLLRRGHRLRIADRATEESLGEGLLEFRSTLPSSADVEWSLGADGPEALEGCDLVVVNPGVPDDHPTLVEAQRRGVRCTQELDLFLEHYEGRVVCITGTNGKSSTTRLLGHALERGGVPCLIGGNIGHSLLDDEDLWRIRPTAVLEVSSFQLERMNPAHRFEGAVLSPITADHLDRHGTLERYHAAKARAAAQASGFLVHRLDLEPASSFATSAKRLLHAREDDPRAEAFRDADGLLRLRTEQGALPLLHTSALRVLGDFQHDNALGAALAAHALGAAPHGLAIGLATAAPLDHRLQELGRIGTLRVVDNGVSTSLDSTASATQALCADGPVHWVGGGIAKVSDAELPALAREMAETLAPDLASAHLFGRVAEPLGRALETLGIAVEIHERLEAALDSALDSSVRASRAESPSGPGQIASGGLQSLLFSPGFASFDQYRNFKERAQAFRDWVRERTDPSGSRAPMAPEAPGG